MSIPLPPFSLEQTISELDGRFDRILLEAGPTLIEVDHSKDGQRLAHHLSVPPANARAEDITEDFGTLFCRYTGRGQQFDLKIRKMHLLAGDKVYQRPLFSGHLKLAGRSKSRLKFPESGAYLNLCLNPSRFLNYQNGRRLLSQGLEGLANWTLKLFANAKRNRSTDEFQFDNNDNWIHSPIENRLGGKWTMPLFRKYFDAVLDTIFSDINRAATVVDVDCETTQSLVTYNLKNVEVYWEFSDPNRFRPSTASSIKSELFPMNRSPAFFRNAQGAWRIGWLSTPSSSPPVCGFIFTRRRTNGYVLKSATI